MTDRKLRSAPPLQPPEVDPHPTFIPFTEERDWDTFVLAASVACPVCSAKQDTPCLPGVFAGYHTPRLRRARAKRSAA